MNTNCNIIKDLLPLYVDNISSEETNKLVEDHLIECEQCQEQLNIMKEKTEVSSIDEKKAIEKFLEKVKKKRLIAILLAITSTLLLVIIIWIIFSRHDFVMEYKADLITVEEQEDGELFVNINTLNYETCQIILEENYDGSVDVFITLYQNLRDKFYATEEFKSFGCVPKCYKNYIEENIDFNWIWENNKGKITLKAKNNVKIANIYYIDNNDEFMTILHSNETSDPFFEMQKIWSSK